MCSQIALDDLAVFEPLDAVVVDVLPELIDVGDLVVLTELLYLDVLDQMLYDEVAVALSEPLGALDELADVEGLVVVCRCQSLQSHCPLPLLTILG